MKKYTELREALQIIEEPNSGRGIPVICAAVYVAKAIIIAGVAIALAIRGRGSRLLGDDLGATGEPKEVRITKEVAERYLRDLNHEETS